MNTPNPVPQSPTPLPGQWDSAIIRLLAYAGLGLVGTILADIFGLSTSSFLEKGGRVIDALLSFLAVAWPLWLAYRARKNNPTPPIAGTPAVEATALREELIAQAPTQTSKEQLMKCSALAVIGAVVLTLAVALSGCTGTRDAYKAAATSTSAPALEATAYVLTEQYRGTVVEAAALKNAGTLSGAPLEVVRKADLVVRDLVFGTPTKPGLEQAVARWTALRSATTEAQLQAAIDAAAVELAKLIRALRMGGVK